MQKANDLIPISKLPDSMRDGRSVMIYCDGIHYCCRWIKGRWLLGDQPISNPTHFSYPPYSREEAGSGI